MLNLFHISLKRRRKNILVDAGTGLLQTRQSRELITVKLTKQNFNPYKMFDKLTTQVT